MHGPVYGPSLQVKPVLSSPFEPKLMHCVSSRKNDSSIALKSPAYCEVYVDDNFFREGNAEVNRALRGPNSWAQNQTRWFESLANYEPKVHFQRIFAELAPAGWKLNKRSIWFVASPPSTGLADQGWKLHISTQTVHAVEVLELCLPLLFEREVYFKFAADSWVAGEINSKLWPRESAGKFITIYPSDISAFLSLGDELANLLRHYAGPYILSDRRWPESRCLFYRYGGFADRSALSVDGLRSQLIRHQDGTLVPDLRKPYFYLPPGITDPCQLEEKKFDSDVYTLKGDRYEIRSALNFTNRGGIYKAVDKIDNKTVIIKEARSLVEIGRRRSDAVQILENEHELLLELRQTGYFVRPLDFFEVWEHSYLVEEYVRGVTLADYILSHNPLYTDSVNVPSINRYLNQIILVWLKVANAVHCAHDHDIIVGDLSINNVIVSDEEVTIIDLEGARAKGAESVGLFTPGFTKRSSWETGLSDERNDLYGLGAIMLASLVMANTFVDYYPRALRKLLNELRLDLDLPEALIALIKFLLDEETLDKISIEEVIEMLEQMRASLESEIAAQPRLTLTAESRFPQDDKSEIYRNTLTTLDGITDYVCNTADVARRDRLFPADMLVFATNPLSVAYGASGVLHYINLARGEIPRHLANWALSASVKNDSCPPGLYLGKSGIAWVMDEIGHPEYARTLLREAGAHHLLWNTADVLHGASGFGLASLKFWHEHNDMTALADAIKVGDWLLRNAAYETQGVRWGAEDETINLGYARGGSGIALFLLYLSLTTGDDQYQRVGRSALDLELQHAAWRGERFLGFPEEPAGGPSPYWAAGTAGVLTTLLRYWAANPDEALKKYVHDFEGDLRHKYAKFPQLFRGLAGMGNTLLDLWYFLQEDRYIRYAWQVAEGVLLHSISRTEGVSFPGARALRESADFATGAAGVGAFLNRLIAVDSPQDPKQWNVNNFNFTLDEFVFPIPAPQRRRGV